MSEARRHGRFIQLNRTFRTLRTDESGNDDVALNRAFQFGSCLTWVDLIKDFRVVVLSEAGPGKTREIRHVSQMLRQDGKPAFFLRLEHIPDQFEEAFEEGSFAEFQSWLASSDEGWLLLDSVDEARLRNPGDFELAVRKVGNRIGGDAQQRAHIVITGRITAWRPRTDLALCERHLPYSPPTKSAATAANRPEERGPDAAFPTEDYPTNGRPSPFKIVAFDDLNATQIEIFAKAKGVKAPKRFLDAVERADARAFAARPQDLEELAQFWIEKGRIGSRLEIIEGSINRRLDERDQGRADARPLSRARARNGARQIAAAVTLTRESTIRIPDGADNQQGIPAGDILPDWDDKELAVLLSRPLFDEAIYGAVRFHHRSVQEFLTAEWLANLLERATSRRNIESLLFRNQYDLEVVVPAMRATLPWLALRDEHVRERICQVAPGILLEGGDPSRLPLAIRRTILRQVCGDIATGASGWSLVDYPAVQHFASEDLVADLKDLIAEHSKSDDVAAFLLRMVWLGELRDALPEVKTFAFSATLSINTRVEALRAMTAIGSEQDMEELRAFFLHNGSELDRTCLAELLDGTEPTSMVAEWLLACLAKTEAKEPFSVDDLSEVLLRFVGRAPVDLLPTIVSGLKSLHDSSSTGKLRDDQLSRTYGWLLDAAGHAVVRLIEARHIASLACDSLAILHRLSAYERNHHSECDDVIARLSAIVPEWAQINRASFWHSALMALEEAENSKREPPTEFWQLRVYGAFWRFDASDFEYALAQVAERSHPQERHLALSLAFHLYVLDGRGRKRRELLKRAVRGDVECEQRLSRYLKPPAQGRQGWKQFEIRQKRRLEARKRKEAQNREAWRVALQEEVDRLRQNGLPPGEISNDQFYLHERMCEKESRSSRWTNGNWKALCREFGGDVALAFRDGLVDFWRRYTPRLISEGAPLNSTPFKVIFGLAGLEIEANEIQDWAANLNPADVDLACRYASLELNGFPLWFESLFKTHPSLVGNFLLQEIRYELSNDRLDAEHGQYMLYDVTSYARWAWDRLAPDCYAILEGSGPFDVAKEKELLTIVQGSSIADGAIARLAAIKARAMGHVDHAALWFAVWVGVDPHAAIPALTRQFNKIAEPQKRAVFAMNFVTALLGGRRGNGLGVRAAFRTPEHLKLLYLLMHKHIRAADDTRRAGGRAFSPGLRDDAQDAREILAELIRLIPGKAAFVALKEIADVHPGAEYKRWFERRATAKAEMDADLDAWLPRQVREFHDKLERTPQTHRELSELALLRLLDLKDDLENGDSSIAEVLRNVKMETDVRIFIGRELREKAFGRYIIPQEEEMADAKKPDLRFHGVGFDAPVPCELKLADRWTGPQLFERMENQLCGDYLRDNRSRRGLFVLVNQGKKRRWTIPGMGSKIGFDGLITALEMHWQGIAPRYPGVDHIGVVGIDLQMRSS